MSAMNEPVYHTGSQDTHIHSHRPVHRFDGDRCRRRPEGEEAPHNAIRNRDQGDRNAKAA